MDQIRYQGYARDRGFNSIQVSTASVEAIGQQGSAMLRQMRENQAAERQTRGDFLQAMQVAQQVERQTKADNFEFGQRTRDRYQEAVNQNYRQRIIDANNAQQNLDKQLTTMSALSNLAPTIGKMVLDLKKKKDEQADLEGQNLVFTSGVTYNEYLQLKQGEAKINAADTQVNNVVNKLKAAGYNEEYISRIRNLSGMQLYGASKQWAIQGGENYGAFRAEIADQPFDVGGRQISLSDAAKGSPEDYSAVNALVRTEYLKQFQGLNPAFANEYLYEGMRKVEARERLLYSEARSKELELDRIDAEQKEVLTTWKTSKGSGIIDLINIKAGGDPKELGEKRRDVFKRLTTLASVGQFTGDDLAELEGTQFLPNGEKKPALIGERFSSDLVELRTAVRQHNAQVRQEKEAADEDGKKAFEQNITQYIAQNGPLTKAEIKEASDEWMARGWGATPGWLKNLDSQEQVSDELGKAELEQKKAYNMLTTKELYSGKYSPELINTYKAAAQQQESVDTNTKNASYGALDAALKQSLGTILQGSNQVPDFFIAQGEARRLLSQNVSELIGQGVTPIEAWKQATKDLKTEILQGQKGAGKFSLRMIDGKPDLKNPGFQLAGQGTDATTQRQRAVKLQNLITKNKQALFHTKLLSESEYQQLEGFRNGTGSIPTILWSLSSRIKNASVFDIADAQLKAADRQPLQRPPSARLYDEVSPEFRQLLTWRPSIDRTLRAVEGGYGGAAGNPYAPVLDLIASKESVSTDPRFNGYDAMNKEGRNGGHTAIGSGTGTANFGRPLTQMTVGEVLSLGRNGKIHAAGRYQFINSTLQALVDRGRAGTGELFNEQVQDRLAVALLREQTGQFWAGGASASSYVPGLGQTWIGLQKLKPGQLAKAMEQARINLSSANVDFSRLKPQVAYRVSGIGPTSTGPHLDVKDVTGAFFGRSALDKFVGFKLPTGIVPISAGVTVAGGRFGASRSYGSHNGWDYAVPDGTPVVLRNGARVISKRPTENGDLVTIAIPDGRRFTFLHGKAV